MGSLCSYRAICDVCPALSVSSFANASPFFTGFSPTHVDAALLSMIYYLGSLDVLPRCLPSVLGTSRQSTVQHTPSPSVFCTSRALGLNLREKKVLKLGYLVIPGLASSVLCVAAEPEMAEMLYGESQGSPSCRTVSWTYCRAHALARFLPSSSFTYSFSLKSRCIPILIQNTEMRMSTLTTTIQTQRLPCIEQYALKR